MLDGETSRHWVEGVLGESPFPWWEWDVAGNVVTASPLKVEMLGYCFEDFRGKGYQAYTDLLHPDDFERTMQAMRDLLEGRAPIYQVDYRIHARDGSWCWYMDRGSVQTRNQEGGPLLVRGVVLNLGEHLHEQNRLEELLRLFRQAVPSERRGVEVLRVCSSCRRIHSGDQWLTFTPDLLEFIDLPRSHGICPDCIRTLYPDLAEDILGMGEDSELGALF